MGPAGTTKLVYTATINANGAAFAFLPAGIGGTNQFRPPAFACYTADPNYLTWWLVTDGYNANSSAVCSAKFEDGAWNVGIIYGTPGWYAAFVVVY